MKRSVPTPPAGGVHSAAGGRALPPTRDAQVADEVEFVAYGEDCILSGRTVLDADRLSDMLNANDEYALVGVTVERLHDGTPLQVDEVVVPAR